MLKRVKNGVEIVKWIEQKRLERHIHPCLAIFSITTCAYIALQLFNISPQDPIYLILFSIDSRQVHNPCLEFWLHYISMLHSDWWSHCLQWFTLLNISEHSRDLFLDDDRAVNGYEGTLPTEKYTKLVRWIEIFCAKCMFKMNP